MKISKLRIEMTDPLQYQGSLSIVANLRNLKILVLLLLKMQKEFMKNIVSKSCLNRIMVKSWKSTLLNLTI